MIFFKNQLINTFFNTNIGFNLLKNRFNNVIIMYHGVTEKSCTVNKRHTLKKDFINHLIFLKKFTNIITLDQFFNQNFEKDKLNVAITFDDGYLNNFTIAKPILEKFQIPATFFVTGINETEENFLWADFVDFLKNTSIDNIELNEFRFIKNEKDEFLSNKTLSIHDYIKKIDASYNTKLKLFNSVSEKIKSDFYNSDPQFWQLMSDENIKSSSNSKYISIQSHSFFHNNLGSIPHTDAIKEIQLSKKYLENLTQKQIDTIGFPDGSYTREIINSSIDFGVTKFLAAEGFLFESDQHDSRILDRKGMYNVGSFKNQIFNALS